MQSDVKDFISGTEKSTDHHDHHHCYFIENLHCAKYVKNIPFNGLRDYHTKCSKSDRERQKPYDITYMWNLKYDTNELIYETETDSQT